MTTLSRLTAMLLLAVLTLTGCGNGDDDTAKANIKKSLLDNSSAMAGAKPTEKQAECVADGMVDKVGVEKMQKYKMLDDDLKIDAGMQPDDVSEEDAQALAGVMGDCLDLEALFEEQFASQEMMSQLGEEQRSCITDAIDKDAIEEILAASFQGDSAEAGGDMQKQIMECVGTGDGEMQLPEE